MTEPKYLTYTLDDNYIIPFLVSAYSANKHHPFGLIVSILQPESPESAMGLSIKGLAIVEESLSTLDIRYQIQKVKVNSFDENKLPLWARFSRTTWLRYYYLFNCDDAIQEIYYIEPDMLFLNSSLSLFDYKPKFSPISARTSPGHEEFENLWKSDVDSPWYFNCGVMVVDVPKWRSSVNQDTWWNVVSRYENLKFKVIDQDALNFILRGKQEILPMELNQYPSEYNPTATTLIHFAGHYKPWVFRPNCLRRNIDQPILHSMKLWDETLITIREILNANPETKKVFKEFSPKINTTARLTIAFPRAMQLVFKFRTLILE
jgi:lipopolysaccharide biosynthesis glycosyltransferase